MKHVEINNFLENSDEYLVLGIEEIKEKLDELSIDAIEIDDGINYRYSDEVVVTIVYNDYEHPIVLKKDELLEQNILFVNPKWYLENLNICQELFNYICSRVKKQEFSINSSMVIDSDLIKSLCSNEILESIYLARYGDNTYSLTNEDYLKFKDSSIKKVYTKKVDKELSENFDDLIVCNNEKLLIENYTYNDLQNREKLTFSNDLSDGDISNFKFIRDGVVIKICNNNFLKLDKIIKELNKLSMYNEIIVEIEDKEKFNQYVLNNDISYDNLYVEKGSSKILFKDYLMFEKKLYDMIRGIENLSPFEKYIYAYNVTKKFKKYKESADNKRDSRDLYRILINDYMVCVGFSEMFGDLLNKLGIENYYLSVGVDNSYNGVKVDDINFEEAKVIEYVGHARRYVHIVDEVYGIDGFYIADPTWDNHMEKDYYNYLALTNNEVLNDRDYLRGSDSNFSELLFVNNVEEYISKINFLLNRVNKKNDIKNLMYQFIFNCINKMDNSYVERLKEKYDYLNKTIYNWPMDISDLVYEIGEYVVNKVNKEISGEVLMEAIGNVYRKAYKYSEEELSSKMGEIIKTNKKRQEVAFPVRYDVLENGSREVIYDVKNKFDIEINKIDRSR